MTTPSRRALRARLHRVQTVAFVFAQVWKSNAHANKGLPRLPSPATSGVLRPMIAVKHGHKPSVSRRITIRPRPQTRTTSVRIKNDQRWTPRTSLCIDHSTPRRPWVQFFFVGPEASKNLCGARNVRENTAEFPPPKKYTSRGPALPYKLLPIPLLTFKYEVGW